MEGLDRLLEQPPSLLFKYMSKLHAQSFLEGRQLHFKSPTAFNDPFDCRPRIVTPKTRVARERLLKRDRARIRGSGDDETADESLRSFLRMKPDELKDAALESWRSNVSLYGVTCFSEDPLNHLMWAHYADCHRGICIAVRAGRLPLALNLLMLKMFYEDERAPFHFPRGNADRATDTLSILNTKSTHWAYEREWRCMMHGGADQCITLPHDAVDHVILGAEISPEVEDQVHGWLRDGFPSASVLRARYSPDTYDLFADVVPART